MEAHAFKQGSIEPCQSLVRVDRQRAAFGQRLASAALDDTPLAYHHGLSGKDSIYPGEDRLAAGGELHLHELVAHRADKPGHDDPGFDQCPGFGRERERARRLGIIERLDAERVAREYQPSRRRVVQCDGVHSAQMRGELEPVTAVQMQRQLAIRLGREDGCRLPAAELAAQLDVVVDLPVRDQRGAARLVKGLVAGREVDDGEPGLHHPHIARAISAVAVRAAVP